MVNVFHENNIDTHLLSFVLNSPVYKKSAIENCDFIVYEKVLREKKTIKPTLKSLSKKYKPISRFVIVFIINDDEQSYPRYDNVIVVRTSLKASKKAEKELVMPFIWDCANQAYPPLIIKNDAPRVGFCGLNSKYRKKLVKAFSQSTSIKTDFILREKFWGGSAHNAQIIKEFNDNIKENIFIISQRGAGNYSMRFYQTLAAGRIPVLVNTDMVLPFENSINWDDLIVFEKNEEACLKKVIDVFTSGKYIQMQKDCAAIFHSYFTDTTFFSHLADQLLTYDYAVLNNNKQRSIFARLLGK